MMPISFAPDPVPSNRSRLSAIRAFTLLEILIALAIIGLLVTLAVNQLGGTFDKARVETTRLFVNDSMKAPLFSYKMAMGDYPSTEEGLQALLTAPANKADKWQGPYLDVQGGKLPLDPWKNPYQYRYPGTHNKNSYDLWSMGPDGKDGTDDDIGNW
jgi:general secretion pathway protein G